MTAGDGNPNTPDCVVDLTTDTKAMLLLGLGLLVLLAAFHTVASLGRR